MDVRGSCLCLVSTILLLLFASDRLPLLVSPHLDFGIQPSDISGQIYVIRRGFPEGEYLVIENRQPIKWSSNWPAGGIVIYHVDEKAPLQTKRGYPGKEGFPQDHYRVAVVQADRRYDIELGTNPGDETDFWTRGQELGPSEGGTVWPNTDSYQSGVLVPTNINIRILTPSAFIMAFQVTGLGNDDGGADSDSRGSNTGLVADDADEARHRTTGHVLEWALSMFAGVSLMLGLAMFVMA